MARTRTQVPLCPGVIGLDTNAVPIPDFQLFSRGRIPGFEECESTVEYTVGEVRGLDGREKGMDVRDDRVVYKKSLGFLGDLKCEFTVGSGLSTLRVNDTYHRLGRASIDTVPSVGKLLEDIVTLQLLANEHAILHCAGLQHDDGVAVLIGVANTGKTTTTIELVRRGDAKYVAEDIAITDGDRLYTCPYALSAIDETLVDGEVDSVYRWLAHKVPLLDRVYTGSFDSIYDVLEPHQIQCSGPVTDVFFLTPDPSREPATDPSKTVRLSNRAEFTYSTSHVLLGAQYLGYDVDVHDAMETEERLLDDLVSGAEVTRLHGGPAQLFDEVRRSIEP